MSTITERLTAYLIIGQETGLDFTITAGYDVHDPYAVRLDFPVVGPDGHLLSWVFGRALLDEGMSRPAGEGDVHVWPCGPDLVMLELCAEAGSALIALPARQLRAFLFLSYAEVPPGYESGYIEIDQLLHDLMGRA
jgi:Streptomyces sporulation and cell division protein, SsgA